MRDDELERRRRERADAEARRVAERHGQIDVMVDVLSDLTGKRMPARDAAYAVLEGLRTRGWGLAKL